MKSLTLLLSLLLLIPMATAGETIAPKKTMTTFRNPLKQDGADPCLTYYKGWYYLATTTASDIRVRKAERIGDLTDAKDQVVWKDDHPERFRDIWAPEFHLMDDGTGRGPRWFLYYTASDGKNGDNNHRMYVLESEGADPMGPYKFKAKLLTDPDDKFYAIDGTVLDMPGGQRYFIWCGRPSTTGQGIYISKMSNPWTLTGNRAYIETSGFGCPHVREAPITLQHKGKAFLIYSACSADTADYKLGMMIADAKSDLTDPASWKQHPKPVLARVDQHGIFGPGHNFFFKSPDGKEDWIVYHAKRGTQVTFGDRSTYAQKFTWTAEGLPDFGLPLPVDADIPVPSGEKK
jgi:GH43 family beta-xylosidase